uniref:Uncharacterized protein n=1 Tax=Percolomonas cosmopolitus TaxID=63605 RepID=A0A7S1KQI6_9EUKA|mmetsp:Transcript_5233/g.19580  ORF Transcript_5233/g.19580 Transcript_5233/m.19580 type:complete len:295 (+) Transcript_5233:898-1782(+)
MHLQELSKALLQHSPAGTVPSDSSTFTSQLILTNCIESTRIIIQSLLHNRAPTSRRSSFGAGRLSIGSNISGDLSEAGVGRSIDARRARKVAHEQAVLLENRVSRLQKLEELYKKRIEQTTKQTNLIKQNKDRHQRDLIEKYKQKLKEREKVKSLARQNARKAEDRKRSVRDARLKCLMEKRQKVQEEKRKRDERKQQQREEEMNLVRQKRERIHSMGTSRQKLRVKRKQSFSTQLQQKYLENTEHVAFEAQLRQKLNERSDLMCDKELEMIERLKSLEAEQQKAVKELKHVLS